MTNEEFEDGMCSSYFALECSVERVGVQPSDIAIVLDDICLVEEDIFPGLDDPYMAALIHLHRPVIQKFSELYGYQLVETSQTMENGYFEPAYVFDDGIGFHYTIDGIKLSIEEKMNEK